MNAVVLVYSIDLDSSFDLVNNLYDITKAEVGEDVLFFLVANKCDLDA